MIQHTNTLIYIDTYHVYKEIKKNEMRVRIYVHINNSVISVKVFYSVRKEKKKKSRAIFEHVKSVESEINVEGINGDQTNETRIENPT